MKITQTRKRVLFLSLLVTSIIGTILASTIYNNRAAQSRQATSSSELNIATSSPTGDEYGLVVPASCPSDLHDDPSYGQACGACNACGSCQGGGAYQCGGVCSVGAPANPPGYGNACTSTNACGASYTTTTTCTGAKATPYVIDPLGTHPPGYVCPPQRITYTWVNGYVTCYVEQCNSSNPGSGTIQCDGTCSGATPPLPVGYGASCQSAPNTCGMQSTGIIGCSGTCDAVVPADALCSKSLQICENSCSSGIYRANGSSFSMFDNEPSRNLVACYTDQVNCSDTDPTVDVTASTTWIENNTPENAVTLSGTSPKVVSPNLLPTPGTSNENVTARYSPSLGLNIDSTVQVNVTKICPSGCTAAEAATVCLGTTYTAPSPSPSCPGVNSICNGARNCNYNWIEVAP